MGRTVSLLRRLHRWIGLILVVPLILQAITGLIMAADPFVASVTGTPAANEPLMRASDTSGVDASAILAIAQNGVAPGLVPVRWRVVSSGVIAVDFATMGQAQPAVQVGVDTTAKTVVWMRQGPDAVFRWVHALHETLFLGLPGRAAVGWIGVGLLLLGLTGILLWWPPRRRWRAAFTVNPRTRGWGLQRELHGAAGIWILLVLLMQSATGIALAFPQIARWVAGLPAQPPRSGGTAIAGQEIDRGKAIAAGIASAQAAIPHATLEDLRLPTSAGRPMTAMLQPEGDWSGMPRALVTLDPTGQLVLSVQDPRSSPTALSVLNWLRALHQGGAGGPATRLLICLFGLALPLLPVTGLTMWFLRRRLRQRHRRRAVIVPGQ
jgi:uncharacterized iron-regulated membrane protein